MDEEIELETFEQYLTRRAIRIAERSEQDQPPTQGSRPSTSDENPFERNKLDVYPRPCF